MQHNITIGVFTTLSADFFALFLRPLRDRGLVLTGCDLMPIEDVSGVSKFDCLLLLACPESFGENIAIARAGKEQGKAMVILWDPEIPQPPNEELQDCMTPWPTRGGKNEITTALMNMIAACRQPVSTPLSATAVV